MIRVAVLIANGSEEIETLTPVNVIRRCGAECELVSVSEKAVVGSRGIKIVADKTVDEIKASDYDGVVVPGGMPGAVNISNCKVANEIITTLFDSGKLVASICASPAVALSKLGITDGKKVTCYPSENFISLLKNSVFTNKDVQVDGNLITANGPKSAMDFSIEICKYLNLEPKF